MTDEGQHPETISELALRYGFEPEKLEAAVADAVDELVSQARFWSWREGPAYEAREHVKAVDTAVQRALKKWREMPEQSRKELANFISAGADDPVSSRLQFLVDLFCEFRFHYSKPPGRPRRARYGDENDLRPLEAFVDVTYDFWHANTDMPFGREVTSDDPRDYREIAP